MKTRQSLSHYELWSIIFQGFGVVSLALIFWQTKFVGAQTQFLAEQTKFVGEQTKLAALQIESNTAQARSANMAAIDAIFVENAAFYSYFYEGKPISPNDPEYAKVLTIAMAMTNYLEGSLDEYDNPAAAAWKQYVDDQFALSPILCDYLASRGKWFDSRLVDIMEKNRARLSISDERVRLLPEVLR